MPEEAKDLISKLLVREPMDRLGAGLPGFDNDMDALKAHPFFNGLDFSKVFLMKPPIDYSKY